MGVSVIIPTQMGMEYAARFFEALKAQSPRQTRNMADPKALEFVEA